ncbi:MAG TPA: hypothetical protein VNQ76_02445, partial [Planctomicrobium sp.]|nr:hypothetical protein [Planctomicrobium sp.]
ALQHFTLFIHRTLISENQRGSPGLRANTLIPRFEITGKVGFHRQCQSPAGEMKNFSENTSRQINCGNTLDRCDSIFDQIGESRQFTLPLPRSAHGDFPRNLNNRYDCDESA